jgi:hypothetical protein
MLLLEEDNDSFLQRNVGGNPLISGRYLQQFKIRLPNKRHSLRHAGIIVKLLLNRLHFMSRSFCTLANQMRSAERSSSGRLHFMSQSSFTFENAMEFSSSFCIGNN